MTWKDKLEIGLKDDAAFRRDNLPDFQKRGGDAPDEAREHSTTGPDRSPEEPGAREEAAEQAGVPPRRRARRRSGTKRRSRPDA
jgi:hypothetical protein